MAFLGIEPDGVRLLADRLDATADLADGIALDISRALFASELTSSSPVVMRGLASGLNQTSIVLRKRADTAQGLVLDLALHSALLTFAQALSIDTPSCSLGPSTTVGFSSPCDPVESIKVFTVAAGAYVPVFEFAGIKLDGAYILRVEHLKSGLLRVTRIDEAALGLAWGAGMDGEVQTGKLTTASGASAKAWAQILMARGTTYEIAAADFDEFLATDLLDFVEDRVSLVGGIAGIGILKGVAKKVVGMADHLPSWKAHDAISALRKRLDWKLPKPLSTFTEGGWTGGTSAGAAVAWFPASLFKGKAGVSISGRAVAGIERREGEQIYYMDMRAEIGTPIAFRVFGIDLSKVGAVETKIDLVRNLQTGDFDRLEFTIVTESGKNIERHIATFDLTGLETQPDAQKVVDGLTDPLRLPDTLDAIEKLLGSRVTTEHATLRRMDKSTYGIEAFGSGGKFTVDELDVR